MPGSLACGPINQLSTSFASRSIKQQHNAPGVTGISSGSLRPHQPRSIRFPIRYAPRTTNTRRNPCGKQTWTSASTVGTSYWPNTTLKSVSFVLAQTPRRA